MKGPIRGRGIRSPLHPYLVHLPIGLFVLSFVLDVLSWISPMEAAVRAAFYAMAFGIGTALLAAIPGFVDYNKIRADHAGKRTASYHMVLNLTVVGLYGVNLGLRYTEQSAASTPLLPLWMSVAGLALLSVSGYLGGTMVYDHGIGVGRHRRDTPLPERTLAAPPSATPHDWVPVAQETALPEGGTLRVDMNGLILCVAKSEGRLYAFQEFCTHRYGPLSEGRICRNEVECPWHRSSFDMETGKPLQGPAKVELKTFEASLRDGQIYVATRPRERPHDASDEIAA